MRPNRLSSAMFKSSHKVRWELSRQVATYLAGGVDNLCSKLLSLMADGLAEGVLDGRIVAVDKVSVYKLHSQ